MTHKNLDSQTTELSATVGDMLRSLAILEYRASELKLACDPDDSQRPNDAAPSVDWRSDKGDTVLH